MTLNTYKQEQNKKEGNMLTLKLNKYTTMERSFNDLLKSFNSIKLNETAAQYVHGLPVHEINTASVLAQHKFDKASTLPGFTEYLNAGIDLSQVMPDCPETKAALDAVTELAHRYTMTDSKREVPFIAYDKQTKQFTVNAAGKQALQDAIVTLSGAEETAYNALYAAHAAVMAANPSRMTRFFSDDIMYVATNKNLRADDVVYFLKLK